MYNLDMYLAVFVIFVNWKWANTLDPLNFPILTFENAAGYSGVVAPNGTGSFVYLPSYGRDGIRVKCVSNLHDENLELEILQGEHVLEPERNVYAHSAEEKSVEVLLTPGRIEPGDYSCRLFLPNDRASIDSVIAARYNNRVTARLSVVSSNERLFCFKNKGNLALKNEFIILMCVAQPSFGLTTNSLKWSVTDDLLCTSLKNDPSYTTTVCALTDDLSDRKISCGYDTNQRSACSFGEIKIVNSPKLSLHPKQFHDSEAQLTFTCESIPPLYPLLWYVFTDEGVLTSENWNREPHISINIISNYVYGSSSITISNGRGIDFVVCSTSVGEGSIILNAISWAGLERNGMSSASPVTVSDEGPLSPSSAVMTSSTPTNSSSIVNGKFEALQQTERVVYLVIIVFLFLLVLVLLGCLIKAVFLQKTKMNGAGSADGSTPSLQLNPAYAGYNDYQGTP